MAGGTARFRQRLQRGIEANKNRLGSNAPGVVEALEREEKLEQLLDGTYPPPKSPGDMLADASKEASRGPERR